MAKLDIKIRKHLPTGEGAKVVDTLEVAAGSFVKIVGPKGDKGDKGGQGLKGDKGDAFTYTDFTQEQLALLKGEKGDKGDTGDTGPQGPKGDTGPQGPQGIQGPPVPVAQVLGQSTTDAVSQKLLTDTVGNLATVLDRINGVVV